MLAPTTPHQQPSADLTGPEPTDTDLTLTTTRILEIPRDRDSAYQVEIRRCHGDAPPCLTILCRHHRGRASLYRRHRASIEAQLQSFRHGLEHLTISGATSVGEANELLAEPQITRLIRGRYVLVLDDDDIFADQRTVERIWQLASSSRRLPWIMIKGQISNRPQEEFPHPWGAAWRPVRGTIPSFSMVVARAPYLRAQHAWRAPKAADWHFARRLWNHHLRPVFLDSDRPLVRTLIVSRGKGEPDADPVG